MKKQKLVVVITTFDLDALRVSVPPLRRLRRKFTLVIYNDNPTRRLSRRDIWKMGWRGPMYIINSENNVGEFESRIRAIEFIAENKIDADWIMFADDDDVLIDIGVPDVANNAFAVVQNATILSDSHVDMFKINPSWANGADVGKTGPHFEITGTMIRATIMFEFATVVRSVMSQIAGVIGSCRYRIPFGALMWNMLNCVVKIRHPELAPIYMNRTNYISIKLARPHEKYGISTISGIASIRATNIAAKKIYKLVEIAAAQNLVADGQ
ncbi:MAG: hypothetical protein J6T57_01240 [Alphaproteobacteria bacterium]|nr:hypothetical protein [Alphaproteobacteria bacterium]